MPTPCPERRAVLAAALLLAAGAPTVRAAAPTPWTLDALMAALARQRVGRVGFVEQKFFAMLDAPVTSSGEMLFTPPDRLERRTLRPRPESVVLQGGVLTLERGGRKTVLPLGEYPAVAALTESVRATLAGDRAALERHYQVQLAGSERRWTLTLLPREPHTRALVLEIEIQGEGGEVRSVETTQADKDRSVLTLRKL